jgi:hypothetical protein
MIQFGIGDAIMHYPGLIEPVGDCRELSSLPRTFVAVHPFSTDSGRTLPNIGYLLGRLAERGLPFVVLGVESLPFDWPRLPPRLPVHIEAVRRCAKFIGTQSCFACAAQVLRKPSFIMVNRAYRDPYFFALAATNGARVEAWNDGHATLPEIYKAAAEWAAK